jgi:hypothetical protein
MEKKLFTVSDMRDLIEVRLERKYVPRSDMYYIHKGQEFVQDVLMDYIETATRDGFNIGDLRRYVYDRLVERTPKRRIDGMPWDTPEELEAKAEIEEREARECLEEEIEWEKLEEN